MNKKRSVWFVGSPEGDVFINGRRVEKETMSRISGFVPQEDLVIQTLTVQEHMEFMVKN